MRISVSSALRKLLPRNGFGDFAYALWLFRRHQGRFPQLMAPSRYSDRLFKMKTDGTFLEPLRQFISDKELMKLYVGGAVGWEYNIETFQVLRRPDEVDTLELGRIPCVLKPTHACGPVLFITDPEETVDRDVLKGWFNLDYYKSSREQNYKFLRPKVIVEEFFSADGQTIPNDYKIFCFNGVPKVVQIDSGRFHQMSRMLYDTNWNRLPFTIIYPGRGKDDPKPAHLQKMLEIAARLSQPFSFIRVDMYYDGNNIKVGELTNSPGSANANVIPHEGEFALGDMFDTD